MHSLHNATAAVSDFQCCYLIKILTDFVIAQNDISMCVCGNHVLKITFKCLAMDI